MKLFFLAIIFGYIIVYKMVCQCRYLLLESPVGTVRFSLREPTVNNCDAVKKESCLINTSKLLPAAEYPYCLQSGNQVNQYGFELYNCTYWDSIEDKNIQEKSLLITTHVQEMNQTRSACAILPAGEGTCSRLWDNAIDAPTDRYVAGLEDFTLLIDHAIATPSIGVGAASRNMTGQLFVRFDHDLCAARGVDLDNHPKLSAPCYVNPYLSKGLDFFTIDTLLRGGAVDLEAYASANQSYRYEGGVAILKITYRNWEEWTGPWDWSGFPHIKSRPIKYIYDLSLIPSSSYKYEAVTYNGQDNRLVKTKLGLKIAVLQTGKLGKFDFQTLLVQLTTSLGLLAVATTIVDIVATKLLRDKKTYKKSKFEESRVHPDDPLVKKV